MGRCGGAAGGYLPVVCLQKHEAGRGLGKERRPGWLRGDRQVASSPNDGMVGLMCRDYHIS